MKQAGRKQGKTPLFENMPLKAARMRRQTVFLSL
jgi:hypothetical protein